MLFQIKFLVFSSNKRLILMTKLKVNMLIDQVWEYIGFQRLKNIISKKPLTP